MTDILQILTQLLKKDQRLVVEGNLAKNKIIELALQLDPRTAENIFCGSRGYFGFWQNKIPKLYL